MGYKKKKAKECKADKEYMKHEQQRLKQLKQEVLKVVPQITDKTTIEFLYGATRGLGKSNGGKAEEYRAEIIEVIQQIDNEKFLMRVYVSLREYLREKQQGERTHK